MGVSHKSASTSSSGTSSVPGAVPRWFRTAASSSSPTGRFPRASQVISTPTGARRSRMSAASGTSRKTAPVAVAGRSSRIRPTAGTADSSPTRSSEPDAGGSNSMPPKGTPRRGARTMARSPTVAVAAHSEPGPGSSPWSTTSSTSRVSAPLPRTSRIEYVRRWPRSPSGSESQTSYQSSPASASAGSPPGPGSSSLIRWSSSGPAPEVGELGRAQLQALEARGEPFDAAHLHLGEEVAGGLHLGHGSLAILVD